MNILLINHYAGAPELGMEYRPYYLSREWVKNGHRVLIIAASFSHLRHKNMNISGEFSRSSVDGIDYCWIKTPPYRGNGTLRVINMFSFIKKLMFNSDFIFRKFIPEVVIASSTYPLDIFPARKISRRFSAKLIFEVHDLWPLSPIELGDFSKYNPLMALFQWAENYYCRHAGKVVSILPNTLPYLEEHGLSKEKFVHVPNGVVIQNESAESLSAGEKQRIDEFSGRYKFIIGYTGAHGKANDLESFISALELLRDQGIAGVLIGKGNEKEALKAIVQRKKLENVLFLEPVRKNRIASLLKEFDALYIGLMNRPLFRFGLSPNKLFDYMLAGKPIIHAINSDWNLVEKAHCGVSCQAGDPDSIAHAIITLSSMSPEERIKRGENGFFYVQTNHSYEYLANKFLKAL